MTSEVATVPDSDKIPPKQKRILPVLKPYYKALQAKIGEHPEIGAAITKLEMALNALAIETGGLL